jgi:hypothetical protein
MVIRPSVLNETGFLRTVTYESSSGCLSPARDVHGILYQVGNKSILTADRVKGTSSSVDV